MKKDHYRAELIADYATEALIAELHTTPKPGLVDCNNSGSHSDMNLEILERSAFTLRPFFFQMALEAINSCDCSNKLQIIGRQAESAMFQTTGGVNTHKGSIFSLGLLVAAVAQVSIDGGDIFQRARELAQDLIATDIESHGSIVKQKYKINGAREEALNGFPYAKLAYEALKKHGGNGCDVLLEIMSTMDDTNLVFRGGIEGLEYAKAEAKQILAAPREQHEAMICALDIEFIKRNLSPGGCADMLAAAYFLFFSEGLFSGKVY